MTKLTKATASTEGVVSFAAPIAAGEVATSPADKPAAVELVGPIHSVLAQASALCRIGFTISIDHMPTMYATTGTAIIVLVPGDPEPASVRAANQAMTDALERERHFALDAEKRAAAAEEARAEQAAKDAAKAVIEAQIVAQQENLRQLEATLAAA
ncbi:hypothetical protein [Massilia sp. AB1]|uniref:hypothetical protein n=1 Tax=Massilia sp. AB1 TaxID=2823371 RepID=UPI001B8385C0|nr:hypothetical protein [Massilia sp. AB1]MBQ5939865.1 hypothetical protein [Massilia sp. AB1]